MSVSERDEFLKRARILIVDDQETNVRLLETILTRAGHLNLRGFTDAREALALLPELQPDLVLLDLVMPGVDGFQFMETMRSRAGEGPVTPVLILTADPHPASKQRALGLGAADFVSKPFDTTELLLRIRNLLETRRLQQQLRSQNDMLEARVCARTRELESVREQLLRAENEKKRFCREILRCVTHGKVQLVDACEIPEEGLRLMTFSLDGARSYAELRAHLRETALAAGMAEAAADDLVLATGEAVANAIKHAGGGECSFYETSNRLLVRVTDQGPGIRPEDVPASILLPGFSSKVSLGMGYTMMLELSDRIWLSTEPEGTVVQLEKWIRAAERQEAELVSLLDAL